MKPEIKSKVVNRRILLREFQLAPMEAWFDQETVAAVRNCSTATVERDRWAGTGIPFIKCSRSVRYTKQGILNWLEKQNEVQSTSQYSKKRINK